MAKQAVDVNYDVIGFPIRPGIYINNKVRLLSIEAFSKALEPSRLNILKLVAFGLTKPSQIMAKLRIPKSTFYRHLNILIKYGWLEKINGDLKFSAPIYLTFTVLSNGKGIKVIIKSNHGAFIDERMGLIIINSIKPIRNCSLCPMLSRCTAYVKALARDFNIRLSSESPAEAYIEILSTIASRRLPKALSTGYLDLPSFTLNSING